MGATVEVKYFNSFILRKTVNGSSDNAWNGSNGDTTYPQINPNNPNIQNWAVEEARIRGGYNNTSTNYGVKAYLVEENPNSSIRGNALIYSGIFNSRTGINNTNVFSVGDDITKSVDPINGSIQKLYAEDTNLIIFQEKKVTRALIDKDAIYTAEGGQLTATGAVVIGPLTAFPGEFGISKNPESFAVYGQNKYFTDKDRNAVLRLQTNGIVEISNYGMIDFFRDQFGAMGEGRLIGGWDIYSKQYLLSIQYYSETPGTATYNTLSFDESVQGWTSLYSYKPAKPISLKSKFYTAGPNAVDENNSSSLYQHYVASQPRSKFYGTQYKSSVEFIFNPKVSLSKVFKTVNYEGSNGWQVDSFASDFTGIGYIKTIPEFNDYTIVNTQDITTATNSSGVQIPAVYSYNEGAYDDPVLYGNVFPAALNPPIFRAGFTRKENKYMSNLVNNSIAAPGEIVFGTSMTGIKGYFATVKISTDLTTDLGGMKELFAASSDYVESAY